MDTNINLINQIEEKNWRRICWDSGIAMRNVANAVELDELLSLAEIPFSSCDVLTGQHGMKHTSNI